MRASSILILARIVIVTLAQWMINLDVVGSVGGVPQDGHVLTSKFIGFNYKGKAKYLIGVIFDPFF